MANSQHQKPLELSGALDKFSYEDTTPEIGREFINVNIVDDLVNAQNADEVLRDLAITSRFDPPSRKNTLSNTGGISLTARRGLLPGAE